MKSELNKQVENIKSWVAEVNKENSKKRDCLKDKKEMIAMNDKVAKDLLELRDDHRSSKDRLRSLELHVAEKAMKREVEEVRQLLELLPTKEEVTSLRHNMKVSIETFSNSNDTFSREFHAHLAIIRRYDEVISEKASKMALYE